MWDGEKVWKIERLKNKDREIERRQRKKQKIREKKKTFKVREDDWIKYVKFSNLQIS